MEIGDRSFVPFKTPDIFINKLKKGVYDFAIKLVFHKHFFWYFSIKNEGVLKLKKGISKGSQLLKNQRFCID